MGDSEEIKGISSNSASNISSENIQVISARSVSTATNLTKKRLQKKKAGQRRIDVWWLADDGGLTALIPHLIRKSKEWRDARIEFYGLSKGDGSQQATVRMAAAQARLGHLLKKIRIDADYRTVDANLAELPSFSKMKGYDSLANIFNFNSNLPEGLDDSS